MRSRKQGYGAPEEHHHQFRNPTTPTVLAVLFRQGKVAKTHLILYWIIESYVEYGKGCWASNAWLARETGTHPRNVSRCLGRLEELGLVKIRYRRDKRWLETSMSRTDLERRHKQVDKCTDSQKCEGGLHKIVNHNTSSLRSEVKTTNADPANPGPHKEDDVSLFEEGVHSQPKGRRGATQEQIKTVTNLHRGFCQKQGWYGPRTSRKWWENEFRALINEYGYEQVHDTLKWYHANHPLKVEMKLEDGQAFRSKFPSLLKRIATVGEKEVVLDPKLKYVAEGIKALGWPAKSKDTILPAVQMTYDALKAFKDRLKAYCENNPLREEFTLPYVRFAHHLLEGISGSGGVRGMTDTWLNKVHDRFAGWSEWQGDLTKHVPKPGKARDNDPFTEWGREIAEEWQTSRMWDKLMGYLY